jgi:hypothetical protein
MSDALMQSHQQLEYTRGTLAYKLHSAQTQRPEQVDLKSGTLAFQIKGHFHCMKERVKKLPSSWLTQQGLACAHSKDKYLVLCCGSTVPASGIKSTLSEMGDQLCRSAVAFNVGKPGKKSSKTELYRCSHSGNGLVQGVTDLGSFQG